MTAVLLEIEERTLLTLREHTPAPLDLHESDLSFLAQHFASKIRIERGVDDAGPWLNPQSHVGMVQLPSGRILRCEPKVPVENLFFMLAVALRFPSPFREEPVDFAQIDDLFDFVVEHFANLVEARLARGLYRAYVEREDNLLTVRGRIAIAEDVRRNHVLRHRTFCRFTEFTWDVPENRVIRQAVHVAAQLVRKRELRTRLGEIDHLLGELDPTPLPMSIFDRFTYHRLNDDYAPIHRLCKLILEGSSVSEELGEFGFRAFLLDMNLLFEQFVTESLIERIRQPFGVRDQVWDRLDDDRRVAIRPDLLLTGERQPIMPADCKYKQQTSDQFRNADLYQMLAYCTALGLDRGALIYPRWESELSGEISIRHSDVRIKFFDVNLGVGRGELTGVMDRLADGLVSWSR